jgi:hypothetical protein
MADKKAVCELPNIFLPKKYAIKMPQNPANASGIRAVKGLIPNILYNPAVAQK